MDEPIAIIGLDARLPGDGETAEKFYESLLAGRSARTEVPADRFNAEAFWHPDAERGGTTRARFAHFLRGSVAAFDAPFFSITPTEASSMDPQQRGILESVYKALENAGIPLATAAGSETGVYVGCFSSDYHDIVVKDLNIPSKYAATGTVASMLSNRVSWFFDFRGPSITIDTACSSSLVAAHEACMSLKLREISMAVVGGCNLILTPEMTLNLDAAGVLGPDGTSYSFDHRGNGYSRGEGFGVIVLKRVSDAIRDGDMIRAVIRNTSSNQDGRSPGITQPTKAAQARLINRVYSRASLDPSLTRFFEAHGTGTAVGDPIEASAIAEVFTPYRSADQPLYVGALKSNVGHLEGAAGVASIIKGVFTLERGIIPANAWFEKPNPKIDQSWHLKFPTKATLWPQSGLRRMSINSFGVGGSNAHVVMDDALHFLHKHHLVGYHRTIARPAVPMLRSLPLTNGVNGINGTNGVNSINGVNGTSVNGTNGFHHSEEGESDAKEWELRPKKYLHLLVLSSFDQDGISRARNSYTEYLSTRSSKHDDCTTENRFIEELSHTLASKRTHYAWRSYGIASSLSPIREVFKAMPTPVRVKSNPQLAFVFTGQGAQWPAMGMELMRYPVFRQSLLDADQYLNSLGSAWSLTYELSKNAGTSRIDDAEFSQPLCTALQIALVDLLATWDIHPRAVTGHSSGEVAAAYAVGAISREAAWKVSYYRGKLSAKLSHSEMSPTTGMAAVGLDLSGTKAAIERVNQMGGSGTLEIACINSWQSHTISGDADKIAALVEQLGSEKIFARKLNVKLAYHSQYMKAIAAEYRDSMGQLGCGIINAPSNPRFFSSTVGGVVSSSKLQEPDYWVENLVSPVRFCEAATELLQGPFMKPKVNGHTHDNSPAVQITDLLEIGPHGALKGPLSNIIKQAKVADAVHYHSVLTRHRSAAETAVEAAGSLFCQGYRVNLDEVNTTEKSSAHRPLMLIDLPSYPFNHSKEYWLESRLSKNFRFRPHGRHELLGAPVPDWNINNAIWRNFIRLSENPWIEDHKVSGEVLYPAAGMLVMAVEASRQLADKGKVLKGFRFKDVSFHLALRIADDVVGVESHFYLRPRRESSLPTICSWNEFQLSTFQDNEWQEHCRGLVQTEYENAGDETADRIVQSTCDEQLSNAQSTCTTQITSEKLYRSFNESGLGYGPTFQTLGHIRLGSGCNMVARVDSSVPRIKQGLAHQYLQPHLVHPATLDGIMQANLTPLVTNLKCSLQPRVPVYASDMWISANSQAAHDSYIVTATAKLRGRQEAESSVTAIQTTTGRPMVYASGLVFRTLPAPSSQNQARNTAYNIDWKPDPTLLTPEQASSVFGLPVSTKDSPSDWMPDCEALCYLYIQDFMSTVSQSTIDQLSSHHKHYISWMSHVLNTPPTTTSSSSLSDLEEKVHSRGTPEGQLILAVGRNLASMLAGTIDPLNVIFGNKVAENVYRHGLGSARCYAQLCSYIDALAHKSPSLEILEIGAGTGGATRSVIEALTKTGRRYGHYDFTDISPSFFEQAKEVFATEVAHMNFRVLNVENDPMEQGFEIGKYDVVIAANVLHATKKIDVSLGHARKLLKPGGKLLLFEITNPAVLLGSFCFGVLPGWWLSEDADRRWGPLMSADEWRKHLLGSGFTGLDAVFYDFPDPAHRMSSILVSSVPAADIAAQSLGSTYLVLADEIFSMQRDVLAGLESILKRHYNYEIISTSAASDKNLKDATCIVLAELEVSFLQNMDEATFKGLKHLVRDSKTLVWVTRGGIALASAPDLELATGLARAARLERPDVNFVTLSFDDGAGIEVIAEKCKLTLDALQNDITEKEVRVINGMTHVPRLVKADYLTHHVRAQTSLPSVFEQKLAADPDRCLVLGIGTLGQLDTLRFEDDPLFDIPLSDDEVEFMPTACGINERDLSSLLGKADQAPLGCEAAGVVTRVGKASKFSIGDRAFGLCFSGAIKTRARTAECFLAKLPDHLRDSDMAAMPLAYTTAYAVLHETGIISRRDTILIHCAVSAIGQAVIHLAQLQGAGIFTTMGSEEERQCLAKRGIPSDNILSNQAHALELSIKRLTSGRGVDMVVNCGDGVDLWKCIAPFGRFIELNQGHTHTSTGIPSSVLERGIRFESFDLRLRASHDPLRTQATFQHMVDLILNRDETRIPQQPIDETDIYPLAALRNAFAAVQTGQHGGHVVLELLADDVVPVVSSPKPQSQFHSDASYVIAGGLGGLGMSMARWMASRGAKNLILLSRRGPVSDAARNFVKELELVCHRVSAPACDVTDAESLRRTISVCMTYMPPIKGCIQGSMVLKDNRLEDMSLDEWNDAVRSKVKTSWNLHNVFGKDLDFFILLSSTVGITGNPEQSNYAAGGTFQDAIARHLASRGIHAVSLDLPVILGVGFVAEKHELLEHMRSTGWAFMNEEELHSVLDYHCRRLSEPTPLIRSQVLPRFWLPQETAADGYDLPAWRNDPLFSHLTQMDMVVTGTVEEKKEANHAALLRVAPSIEEAEKIVLEALLLKLSRVLSVDVSNLDPAKPLHAYGVDSLVAVELRSWLTKELRAEVSVFDMMSKGSIYQLISTATARSELTPGFKKDKVNGVA